MKDNKTTMLCLASLLALASYLFFSCSKRDVIPKGLIEGESLEEFLGKHSNHSVSASNTVGQRQGPNDSGEEIYTVPSNKLGAIMVGRRTDVQGYIRLIRLKHSLSDWWQDPTAIPSLIKWLSENTKLRADLKFEGGALPLTDRRILDAPIIFMTGHDKDITVGRNLAKDGPLTDGFSSDERAALREYLVEDGITSVAYSPYIVTDGSFLMTGDSGNIALPLVGH